MKRIGLNWTMAVLGICVAVWSAGQTACSDDRTQAQSADDNNDDDNNNDDNNDDNNNNDDDNDGDDDDDGSDVDSDADSDADSDTDSDTEACTPPTWGNSVTVGQKVANWSLNVIYDQDGDGTISGSETTAVPTTLEEIYCSGVNSVAIYVHDGD